MAKIVRARYENGVLRPLESLDLEDGEEVRIAILPKEFPELVEEVEATAREDIDDVLREGRERWVEWYSIRASS